MQTQTEDSSECVDTWLKVGCDAVLEKDHPVWIEHSPDIGNPLVGHPESALRQFEWGHFEKAYCSSGIPDLGGATTSVGRVSLSAMTD